ncbi:hypothetical protein BD414DRAFT_329843 [Trametes punicea]|nr:hypothetical protein BD414DRAFT_329843 [Trametes punicea]
MQPPYDHRMQTQRAKPACNNLSFGAQLISGRQLSGADEEGQLSNILGLPTMSTVKVVALSTTSTPTDSVPAAPTSPPSDTTAAVTSNAADTAISTSSWVSPTDASATWQAPTSSTDDTPVQTEDVPSSQWSPTNTTSLPPQTTTQMATTLISVVFTVSVSGPLEATTTVDLAPTVDPSASQSQSQNQLAAPALNNGEIAAICLASAFVLVLLALIWRTLKRGERERNDAAAQLETDVHFPVQDGEGTFSSVNIDVEAVVYHDVETSHREPYPSLTTRRGVMVGSEGSEEKHDTLPASESRESLIGPAPSVRSSSTLSYINTLCPETAESPTTVRALPPVPSYDQGGVPPHAQVVGSRPLPIPVPVSPFPSIYVPEERTSVDSRLFVDPREPMTGNRENTPVLLGYRGLAYGVADSRDGQPPEYSRY